jgi:hypothetical protein
MGLPDDSARISHQIGQGRQIQFQQNTASMRFHGAGANAKPFGDGTTCHAFCHQAQHFGLSTG